MPDTITLRPWTEADAARVYELFNSPALTRNLLSTLPTPYTLADAQSFMRRCNNNQTGGMERAIVYKGEFVGTVGSRFNGHSAMIGYWLGEAYWGKRIMSRALPLYIDELPQHITHLTANTFEFNAASQALLLRCGFTQLPGRGVRRSYDQNEYATVHFERAR